MEAVVPASTFSTLAVTTVGLVYPVMVNSDHSEDVFGRYLTALPTSVDVKTEPPDRVRVIDPVVADGVIV